MWVENEVEYGYRLYRRLEDPADSLLPVLFIIHMLHTARCPQSEHWHWYVHL
jgi:hypothetical protein